jgi:hypothetical protein
MKSKPPVLAPRATGEPLARKTHSARSIPVESLVSEQPRAMFAYWSEKCTGRALPAPKDIDPIEIPRLLPYLTLLDVLDESPIDYYYRLEGETLRSIYGYRRAGHRLSEHRDVLGVEGHASVLRSYEIVRSTKKPIIGTASLIGLGRGYYSIEWVCLPLSRDGDNVHRILSCVGIISGPAET